MLIRSVFKIGKGSLGFAVPPKALKSANLHEGDKVEIIATPGGFRVVKVEIINGKDERKRRRDEAVKIRRRRRGKKSV